MTKVQHWVAIGSVFVVSAILGRPAEADVEKLDIIYGNPNGDRIAGTSGPDEIYGSAEQDFIEGLGGADKIDCGGSAWDTVSYQRSPAAVSVILALLPGYPQTGGDAQGDTIVNCETLTGSYYDDLLAGDDKYNLIIGLEGNDLINGFGGPDWLVGGIGNDTLLGGSGRDRLEGGPGADIFRFGGDIDSPKGDSDGIVDFGNGNDKLHFQFMTVGKVTAYTPLADYTAVLAPNEVGYTYFVGSNSTVVRTGASSSFRIELQGFTGTLSMSSFLP
ncbi:MAG TPA: calcium-binding protein [Polyangium sp.]|nr:calcium-binding protein [Polyangium sp.]